MMGMDTDKQNQLMFMDLNEFIPQDHLLRAIQRHIDFSFVYEKVNHLYSTVGRKSIDPVILIKMLLLGYLYGISSERKLEQEVRLNLAYRWFLGLDLTEPVPDHSTLSQNRRRRFKDSTLFQDIFDHVVLQCVKNGLVSGEVIMVDSTHVKASASLGKTEKIIVEKKPSQYFAELEKEARRLQQELNPDPDKKKRGRKPKEKSLEKEEVRSKTDPDAGLLNRPNKPKGFHFLAHASVDAKHGIITDIHVTAGNVNDHQPIVDRLGVQLNKFDLRIQKAVADKGYDRAAVHYGLEKMQIEGYISPVADREGYQTGESGFFYDKEQDAFICPSGKTLTFTHVAWNTDKQKFNKVYAAKVKDCRVCPLRITCFGKAASHRTIGRSLFFEALERNRNRARTDEYVRVQRLRRIWCEGTFGTLKKQHNLRETYKRGIRNVTEHCLFSALAMNIKRIIKATA